MTTTNFNMIKNKKSKNKMLLILSVALAVNLVLISTILSTAKKKSPVVKPQLQITSAPKQRLATFSLNPQNLFVKANEIFTLQISLASKFPLSGADAILEFNPDYLTVEKASSSQMFKLYPRLSYDNSTGQIIITGVNIDFPNSPNLSSPPNFPLFATLTFSAKKLGTAQIKFNYKPNSTTASTAVRAKDSKNVLTHVNNATIKIQ